MSSGSAGKSIARRMESFEAQVKGNRVEMQGKVSMNQSDGAQGRAQARSRWVPRLLGRASIAQALVVFAGIQLCTGCDMGSGGSGALTGRSESAPPISEIDDQNQYRPYRATGDLQRPRYFHMGISAKDGRP